MHDVLFSTVVKVGAWKHPYRSNTDGMLETSVHRGKLWRETSNCYEAFTLHRTSSKTLVVQRVNVLHCLSVGFKKEKKAISCFEAKLFNLQNCLQCSYAAAGPHNAWRGCLWCSEPTCCLRSSTTVSRLAFDSTVSVPPNLRLLCGRPQHF
jgi:hypothetical protein